MALRADALTVDHVERIAAADALRARARRRSRALRIGLACAAVLIVCGLVAIAVLAVVDHRQDERAAGQRDALNAARGAVTAMLTATPKDAAGYADRIIAMRDGRIISQGEPREVVTEELVHEVFDIRCRILTDPDTGTPVVLPRGMPTPTAKDQEIS